MLDFNLFMYSFIYLYLFIWLLFGKYASLVLRKIKKILNHYTNYWKCIADQENQ